ncbi:uncharacterized protein [Dermacentor andersoni]|uniref:uncharacterized protein n=1 Tax=Dermacentor andersoni TaxID=34620 RepID=UPI003B3A272C
MCARVSCRNFRLFVNRVLYLILLLLLWGDVELNPGPLTEAAMEKNVDLENRSRRLNLVFYGIDDGNHSETWIQSENLVKDICKTNLGIELNSIQRAHRVGRYSVRFKRPVLVNFSSYKEKQDVLSNANKFKGSPYSVDQDYSSDTREIRKHLWEYAKVKKADSKTR